MIPFSFGEFVGGLICTRNSRIVDEHRNWPESLGDGVGNGFYFEFAGDIELPGFGAAPFGPELRSQGFGIV